MEEITSKFNKKSWTKSTTKPNHSEQELSETEIKYTNSAVFENSFWCDCLFYFYDMGNQSKLWRSRQTQCERRTSTQAWTPRKVSTFSDIDDELCAVFASGNTFRLVSLLQLCRYDLGIFGKGWNLAKNVEMRIPDIQKVSWTHWTWG